MLPLQQLLLVAVLCAAAHIPQAAGQTIGGISCPSGASNIENVPVGSNLGAAQYSTLGKTYQLAAGTYYVRRQITITSETPNPGTICYIGTSSDQVTVVLDTTDAAFTLSGPEDVDRQTDGPKIAFQKLTLDGRGKAGGVSVDFGAAVASDQVVIKDCPVGVINARSFGPVGVTLSSTKVLRCGTTVLAPGNGGTDVFFTWSNVEFSESTGPALDLSLNAVLTISGSAKFLGNKAGGALRMTDSTSVTMESAEFVRNSAVQGGAMLLERFSVVTVTGSLLVQENTATDSGGGVFATDRAQLRTQGEATFSLNSAGVSGGALSVTAASCCAAVFLEGVSTFTGNSAADGGAVFLQGRGLLFLQKTRMINNQATRFGGAMYIDNDSLGGNPAAEVLTGGALCISGNTATTAGGGVYLTNFGTLDLQNSASAVMGTNAPTDIDVVSTNAEFICSDGGDRSQGQYTIAGPICSCPVGAPGAAVTCATCPSGQRWAVGQCTCRDKCSEGDVCCEPPGVAVPSGTQCSDPVTGCAGACNNLECATPCECRAGTVCRRAAGLCDVPEICTDEGLCPADKLVLAGTLCRHGHGSCEVDTTCNGEHPGCDAAAAPNGQKCPFDPEDQHKMLWGAVLSTSPELASTHYYDEQRTGRDDQTMRDASKVKRRSFDYRAKGRRGMDYEGAGAYDDDLPPCVGKCLAGNCQLDSREPGCCKIIQADGYMQSQEQLHGEAQYQGTLSSAFPHSRHSRNAKVYCWEGSSTGSGSHTPGRGSSYARN